MARRQTGAKELARLLHGVKQPIYVLDDEYRLVFCNEACVEWLGVVAEDLLGRRCTYQSGVEQTQADALASGLCPPPAAMAGQVASGVVGHQDERGEMRRRRARFCTLGSPGDEPLGLIVFAEATDLAEGDWADAGAADEAGEAAALHERIRQFRAEAAGRYRMDRLIGQCPAIRRARAQAELAACSRASVLVIGSPGSGRQHVAATIHYAASGGGALIPLACSVLGAELIHSTITALVTKAPLEERTGQSTLLLSEVDQLPIEAQAELAALLSAKSFPLRLIATARRRLSTLAEQGEYHAGLAAALGTIEIELPALAERREDLPVLAQLFLEDANSRGGKQVGGFSAEALDRLDAYRWPGNMDELAGVVAEAHQSAEGPQVGVGDLPRRLHLAADAAAHPRRVEETIVLDRFLGEIERELVRRALERAKGNKAKAARLLGLTRPRLYRRMVQLGLEEGRESAG